MSKRPTKAQQIEVLGERVLGLLAANSDLVMKERDARHKWERAEADVIELAQELTKARREISVMQRIAEGKPFSLRGMLREGERFEIHGAVTGRWNGRGVAKANRPRPDRDTTGGFDVVCDQRQRSVVPRATQYVRPQRGFDVGNGIFCVGDECIVHGNHATILDVFQDGEAEVRYRDGVHTTVKWVVILPTDNRDRR